MDNKIEIIGCKEYWKEYNEQGLEIYPKESKPVARKI